MNITRIAKSRIATMVVVILMAAVALPIVQSDRAEAMPQVTTAFAGVESCAGVIGAVGGGAAAMGCCCHFSTVLRFVARATECTSYLLGEPAVVGRSGQGLHLRRHLGTLHPLLTGSVAPDRAYDWRVASVYHQGAGFNPAP